VTGPVNPRKLPCGRFAPAWFPGKHRRGVVLVWVAIFIFVLVAIVGLSLDWGKLAFNVHQLQNAADAGALAGAQLVKFDIVGARERAIALAFQNRAENRAVSVADNPSNAVDGELVVGRWIRQERRFIETLLAPNAVKVVATRRGQRSDAPPLSLLFGPMFGINETGAGRPAIGWAQGSTGAGIICLATDPNQYRRYGWPENGGSGAVPAGGGKVDLSGYDLETGRPIVGDWQVNSRSVDNAKPSFNVEGSKLELEIGELNTGGTTDPDADDAGAWSTLYAPGTDPFSVNPYSLPVEDPLKDIVPPDIAAMPKGKEGEKEYGVNDTITGGTHILSPGYYPGGIQMTGGDITLLPGVYAFGGGTAKNNGPGLVVGGGTLRGNGVMLYITGDPDGSKTTVKTEYGRIDIGGNATLNIVSRGDAMTPKQVEGEMGVALWQDRANISYTKIIGGGNCDVTGTIYCGYNAVELGGTFDQMGNQVIAGALALAGNINLHIAYDGRNRIRASRSILVE
jgi:hypothetical protein